MTVQLIPELFRTRFGQQLRKELVIGDVSASKEFEAGTKEQGESVTVPLRGKVTYSSYTGGDLSAREAPKDSEVKIVINKGGQIHFEISKLDEIRMASDPERAKQYVDDGAYQAKDAIDSSLGDLYVRAGIVPTDNSASRAIDITKDTAHAFLAYMAYLLDENNVKKAGRYAIVPDLFATHLGLTPELMQTESGKKMSFDNGVVGSCNGFEVRVSQNLNDDSSVYKPLFGIKGETFACIRQKDLDVVEYMPDLSMNKTFKGIHVYGCGVARPDMLATAYITLSAPITW